MVHHGGRPLTLIAAPIRHSAAQDSPRQRATGTLAPGLQRFSTSHPGMPGSMLWLLPWRQER
jgi:hypothetical protein